MAGETDHDAPMSEAERERIEGELRTIANTRAACFFFLACAPLVPFTIQLICPISTAATFGTFLFFFALCAYCSHKTLRSPCPRCHKRFFVSDNLFHNTLRSRCAHCQLPLR